MITEIPDHGTSARYKGRQGLPGCRCRRCIRAVSRADTERRLDRLSGRPRTAPAGRVQQVKKHLQYLVGKDMSHCQIAASAGISQATVSQLISGQRSSLRSITADRLMGVKSTDRTETCMVTAVGAARRVRALYWMGHRPTDLSDATGLHVDTVLGLARCRWEKTTAARFEAVSRVYDQLSMTRGMSTRSRNFAVRNDWDGPLAWDDESIDDPRSVPHTDAVQPVVTEGENVADRWLMGESVILGRDERRQVLQHLFEWTNDTTAQIADRLDMTPSAAERQWERIKEAAAAEGQRVWRRAYVPRERDLSQNQMEEAA